MSKTLLESWEKEYPSIDFKEFLKEQQAAHDKDMGIQIKLAYGEGILEGEERGKKAHDKEIKILSVALDNAPDAIDYEEAKEKAYQWLIANNFNPDKAYESVEPLLKAIGIGGKG